MQLKDSPIRVLAGRQVCEPPLVHLVGFVPGGFDVDREGPSSSTGKAGPDFKRLLTFAIDSRRYLAWSVASPCGLRPLTRSIVPFIFFRMSAASASGSVIDPP